MTAFIKYVTVITPVEAMPISLANHEELASLGIKFTPQGTVIVPTPEGDIMARYGDYLLRSPEGYLYTSPRSAFDRTHQRADSPRTQQYPQEQTHHQGSQEAQQEQPLQSQQGTDPETHHIPTQEQDHRPEPQQAGHPQQKQDQPRDDQTQRHDQQEWEVPPPTQRDATAPGPTPVAPAQEYRPPSQNNVNPNVCPKCGRPKKPEFAYCFKCSLCPKCQKNVKPPRYDTCYECRNQDRQEPAQHQAPS